MNTVSYYNVRNKSIIKPDADVEHLYTLGKFPVFIGATNADIGTDLFSDLTWDVCVETGCIQLRNLLPPSLIYSEYHSEALGGVWVQHHKDFERFCDKYLYGCVVELGGSNGDLARKITTKNLKIDKYVMVEPNPSCVSGGKLEVIEAFFDMSFAENFNSYADCVIHSHTFEHTYEPRDFVAAISKITREGSYHVFSVPKLKHYLQEKYSNTLNFEHTFLLEESIIMSLMQEYGFELIEKKDFLNHSVFYAFIKKGQISNKHYPNNLAINKKTFDSYIQFFKSEVMKLNEKTKVHDGSIYIFGGHVFSQFLIAFGLNEERIQGIVDNSEYKNNKRLYGTNLIIKQPSHLAGKKNVAVILKAGQYQDEIRAQLYAINPEIEIWE